MIRLALLLLVCAVAGALVPPATTVAPTGRLAGLVAAHLALSPAPPTPLRSTPNSSSEILADEIEREDDFKEVGDFRLGTAWESYRPTGPPFTRLSLDPPAQPTPWTLSPRFRC